MAKKLVVVHPFVLTNKTYMPKEEISDSVFSGQGLMLDNMLKSGMVRLVGSPEPKAEQKPVINSVKIELNPSKAPPAVEFKTDKDLQKVIEAKPEPPKSVPIVEEEKPKGRAARK